MSDEGYAAHKKSSGQQEAEAADSAINSKNFPDEDECCRVLSQYELSLENEDNRWREIERMVVRSPPKVCSKQGALSCLRIVRRYGVHNRFGETLVEMVTDYLERAA